MPSPRSPIAWPRDSFRISLSLVAALGAVGVVLVSGLLAVFVGLYTGQLSRVAMMQQPARIPADFTLWSQFAVYVPIIAYLLLVIRPVSGLSFRDLGIRAPGPRDLAVGIGGAAAMWVAVTATGAIVHLVTHRDDTEAAIELLRMIKTPAEHIEFVVIAVVLAPLVEEFAFRVFAFNAFLRWTPLWVAAVASSLLFGLVHAQTPGQIVTVGTPLVAGGIVLAYVYARTRCYWSSVLAHALFNSVSVILVFVFHVKT